MLVRLSPDSVNPLADAVCWGTAVIAAFGAVATLLTPAGPPRWGSAAPLVIVVVTSLTARWARDGRVIPGWLALALPPAALLAAWLPGVGLEGCLKVSGWAWGPWRGWRSPGAAILLDGGPRVLVVTTAAYLIGCVLPLIGLRGSGVFACQAEELSSVAFHVAVLIALLGLGAALRS